MPWWSERWEEALFQHAATASKLGVNYVQASAPSTTIELQATSLDVGQDLAKHGIAGVVWNCARAMVSFLEAESQLAAHRHVLELGAGPGAVGLALASTGAVSSLLLTDLESVVPLTCSNANAAATQHETVAMLTASNRLDVRALCWGEPADGVLADRHVDFVIASDCLYESASHSAFLSTLLEVTKPPKLGQQDENSRQHAVVLVAYKQRLPIKEKIFFETAANYFNIAVYAADPSPSSSDDNCGNAVEYYDEAIYMCKLERKDCDTVKVPPE
ncbi:protein-lysine methyltransferase METTL21D [Phytophthora cinnamomi]|uniref:protein-lysine methyltransferase METTL21D n=1 Tax=Phytophthora cinnamomi TaxID=4785 RepID=UPI0035597868|nr:protein-lysine methyltransferase METTL21D [Phytophthora cinnamomi]